LVLRRFFGDFNVILKVTVRCGGPNPSSSSHGDSMRLRFAAARRAEWQGGVQPGTWPLPGQRIPVKSSARKLQKSRTPPKTRYHPMPRRETETSERIKKHFTGIDNALTSETLIEQKSLYLKGLRSAGVGVLQAQQSG
jgi:hypothetical protein